MLIATEQVFLSIAAVALLLSSSQAITGRPANPDAESLPRLSDGDGRKMETQLREIECAASQLADFAHNMTTTQEGREQLYAPSLGSSDHIIEALSRLNGKLDEAQRVVDVLKVQFLTSAELDS